MWVSKPGERHRSSRPTCRVPVDEYRRPSSPSSNKCNRIVPDRPRSDHRFYFDRFPTFLNSNDRHSVYKRVGIVWISGGNCITSKSLEKEGKGWSLDPERWHNLDASSTPSRRGTANRESLGKFARGIAFGLQGRAFE